MDKRRLKREAEKETERYFQGAPRWAARLCLATLLIGVAAFAAMSTVEKDGALSLAIGSTGIVFAYLFLLNLEEFFAGR